MTTNKFQNQSKTNNNTDKSPEQENQNSNTQQIIDVTELKRHPISKLIKIAEELGVENPGGMLKQNLIFNMLAKASKLGITTKGRGVIEVLPDGFAFMRWTESNYVPSADDIYISASQVHRLKLRTGDILHCEIKPPKKGERYFTSPRQYDINYQDISSFNRRAYFDNLIPIYPDEKLNLEHDGAPQDDLSMRIIDIVAPIGKGQRALIVSPPRSGKTMLMQNIAHAITANHPDVKLIVLLIDERPEEVTDMIRSVKGEIVSSTFGESASQHVHLAEIVVEKAKRLVENKKNVVLLLDSITRLARAYNTVIPSSGKILTGGVDSNALQRPKRFFGAARNIDGEDDDGDGGSLTIIATALVETGSRMDEVIFEEFKGTGNCEIILDRKIADKRIFPAIDITKSGTRKEELLLERTTLAKIRLLRRILNNMDNIEAIEFLRDKMRNSENNDEFFSSINN